jgi:protein transport protein SEC20
LGFLVDDQQGEKARRELRAIVDTFREALDRYGSSSLIETALTVRRMRKDTRSALLLSKKAIESQRTAHRDELLSLAGVLKEKEENHHSGASDEKFG